MEDEKPAYIYEDEPTDPGVIRQREQQVELDKSIPPPDTPAADTDTKDPDGE
jgi:hypothetical protein